MSLSKARYGKVVAWSDLPEEVVRPGVRRCGYATDDVMLVMNTVEKGLEVNPHVHRDFDQLAWIVSGRAIYHVGDQALEMGPGTMVLIPAGLQHYIEPLDDVVLNLDVFAPPRADLLHLVAED